MMKYADLWPLLDDPSLDPDPDFRNVLIWLNAKGGARYRTVSSCQGHAPGAQYPDVLETMNAYVTLEMRDFSAMSEVEEMFVGCPHLEQTKRVWDGGGLLLNFTPEVQTKWAEVYNWLRDHGARPL